jgi:two-component system cell cycle sensor histidine kinase/response regulator CckA
MSEVPGLPMRREVLLVVDDDSEARDAIRLALELEGYIVHTARTGAEGVSLARAVNPDLILMDVLMPAVDGIRATRILKGDPFTRPIPIILVTVVNQHDDIVKGLEAGATDYITKPFFLPELKARVRAVLSIKRFYEECIRERERAIKWEERYRLLVENASVGIVVVQDEEIQFCNQKASEILGLPREKLNKMIIKEIIHADDRKDTCDTLKNLENSDGQSRALIFRIDTVDGNIKWLENKVVTHQWEGKPATLNFISDISRNKRLQEEKAEFERQLQQAQKMEAIGTLASGIAHDFNNLLQAVLGYAQLLLSTRGVDHPEFPWLQNIVSAAERGSLLIRQLLTFSRRMGGERRRINLNDEVRNISRLLDCTTPKGVEVELKLAEDLYSVNADPAQIQQVIMNLAVNAKDAMPHGGKLIIQTENVILDEDVGKLSPEASPGRYVVLTVMDRGQGMDEETLKHAFEPFFTTKEVGKGTGLGLALVYGIVKGHRGFIDTSSAPGRGTKLRIYLPASNCGRSYKSSCREEDVETTGGEETILVVDDDEMIRDLAVEMLSHCGYTVITAPDGETAIELFRKQNRRIALVILDLIMPGMDGKRCLSELLRFNPEAKIIIASGYASLELGTEILKLVSSCTV